MGENYLIIYNIKTFVTTDILVKVE